jgi:hypothetical protein
LTDPDADTWESVPSISGFGATGTSARLRVVFNDPVSSEVAQTIGDDFHLRFERSYNLTFAATQAWQPTIFDDYAVYTQKLQEIDGNLVASAMTRVRSIQSNIWPVAVSQGTGGGGGGAIMHFRITEVDCDLYGSGWWCVEPTHYTGACSEPPGKDPYDGKYYVRPFCGSPFTQDELEATGTGVATFTYDLETCEQFWLEISHCADQGC